MDTHSIAGGVAGTILASAVVGVVGVGGSTPDSGSTPTQEISGSVFGDGISVSVSR